ncbi:MAG: PBP1A family penicillin-binding protein [Cyanobacteria bacterium]|nr:PBP1A family penicillin-binding protein [Cyanobacteriota bacterium]
MASIPWQPRPWHLRAAAIAGLLFLAVFGWFVIDLAAGVPNKKELAAFSDMASANILFDAADREVFTIAREHRIEVPLAEISPNLIKAVIAVEDRRFFEHDGFDPIRIVGAALAVVREREAVQGGSTITQQLARQSVGREKTLRRKLRELLFAAQLEHHFTKKEILELYLNKVYFGDGLYGAEAASRGYFGKKASELSIGEASLLAGLLKAPASYDPSTAPQKAEARQTVVLKAMLDSKAITREEYDQAFKTQIEIYDGLRSEEQYGQYFKDEVRRQLVEQFGEERVEKGGLKVYTTIDPYMQRAADAAVDQSIAEIEKKLPRSKTPRDPLQAALIAIDPDTGAVRALVGGRDFRVSNFNRATRARRQPGSAFKPFVYAAAVEDGFGPDDLIEGLDEPVEASNAAWTPDDEHVDDEVLTLREGLRLSSNRAAVRLLTTVGLRQTMKQARGFGFDDLPAVPSVALGSGEVTLTSITAAYGAFANNGEVFHPHFVRRVVDENGKVLYENHDTPQQPIRPVTAYLMADMLRGVIDGGTGYGVRQMGFNLPAAGKTGTTNDYKDAWFIGFTPSLVAGVWVGYDHPQTIRRNGYAAELAVPMWTRFMKAATKGMNATWIERPRGAIRDVRFNPPPAVLESKPLESKPGFWSRIFGRRN